MTIFTDNKTSGTKSASATTDISVDPISSNKNDISTIKISEKDHYTLINKVNTLLEDFHARVFIEEAPTALLDFYAQHTDEIKGEVVIVRSKEDESHAAYVRNHTDKALFVFSDTYWMTSYFSGTCQKINIPQALIRRLLKENR